MKASASFVLYIFVWKQNISLKPMFYLWTKLIINILLDMYANHCLMETANDITKID